MFDRVCYIEFVTANGQLKRLEGIDVDFSVNKYMGAVMNEAQATIYNLAKEDVEYLTTFTSQWIAINQRKRLRIFAGYKDTNVGLIFDGDIVEAMPSSPPDVALRCKAMSGYYNNLSVVSKSMTEQISVHDLLKQVSAWTGLTVNDYTTTTKNVSGFYHTGSLTSIISELNNIPDIIVYEEDGAICAVDTNNTDIQKERRKITIESGLIGMAEPNALGVKCQILLDPNVRIGQQIELESSLIPACNGVYTIYELCHKGALRGTDFYTEITARRR